MRYLRKAEADTLILLFLFNEFGTVPARYLIKMPGGRVNLHQRPPVGSVVPLIGQMIAASL